MPLIRNGKVVKRPVEVNELTKVYTDEALDFIERNKEGPFFLYLPHTMLRSARGQRRIQGKFKLGRIWRCHSGTRSQPWPDLDSLKRLKMADNTLVVYASDNGRGPGRNPEQKIRGRKLSTFEGGIRVPAIAWGPGLGLPAGLNSSAVTRAMDWYPTFCHLCRNQGSFKPCHRWP